MSDLVTATRVVSKPIVACLVVYVSAILVVFTITLSPLVVVADGDAEVMDVVDVDAVMRKQRHHSLQHVQYSCRQQKKQIQMIDTYIGY